MMLLTLSSHIYIYTANIYPSLAFCYEHDYPLWHFRPNSLTLQQRCKRINWSIHSAGGCSATGAMVLAVWHFCALLSRLWGVLDKRSVDRLSNGRFRGLKTKLQARRKRDADTGVDMLDWQHLPKDVDVRSRSTRRSARSGALTGMDDIPKRLPTVSQEELEIGMRRKRRREEKDDGSSSSDIKKEVRGSRWSWKSEGFFECLA
jgi:hypothetical protein